MQQARRYMLTGDEFTATEAQAMGVVLDVVPDDELATRSMALAQRIAQVPANQLEMITWALNAVADHQYDPAASRRLGTLFDGVARHSQEGMDFVAPLAGGRLPRGGARAGPPLRRLRRASEVAERLSGATSRTP